MSNQAQMQMAAVYLRGMGGEQLQRLNMGIVHNLINPVNQNIS